MRLGARRERERERKHEGQLAADPTLPHLANFTYPRSTPPIQPTSKESQCERERANCEERERERERKVNNRKGRVRTARGTTNSTSCSGGHTNNSNLGNPYPHNATHAKGNVSVSFTSRNPAHHRLTTRDLLGTRWGLDLG